MKAVIIANPNAGGGRVARHWHQYSRAIAAHFGPADMRFTQAPGEATSMVLHALEDGFSKIVVVGGDGTFNEALNGFVDKQGLCINAEAMLALFPVGTGGDFARSIGMVGTTNEHAYAQVHGRSTTRHIDIGKVTFEGPSGSMTRFFLNVSSVGVSGEITRYVNQSSKRLGGRASFYLGTLRGMAGYRNRRVRLRIDDDFEEELVVNLIAVANGRYFGGAMKIAPQALLNDGALDIVIVGDVSLSTFARYSGRLYKGSHIGLPFIRARRGRKVWVTPLEERVLRFETDGEQIGKAATCYEVIPAAIKLFAPWESAEAIDDRADARRKDAQAT